MEPQRQLALANTHSRKSPRTTTRQRSCMFRICFLSSLSSSSLLLLFLSTSSVLIASVSAGTSYCYYYNTCPRNTAFVAPTTRRTATANRSGSRRKEKNNLFCSNNNKQAVQSGTAATSALKMSQGGGEYEVVTVDLAGGRDYPIYIGAGYADDEAGKMLTSHIKGSRVLIITNDKIAPMYLEKYESMLKKSGKAKVDTLILPDGEENKSMDVLMKIMDKALEIGLDRKATFVALGGGVIGDMVGFAAAIFLRGVNFIQVPTTVMAMVDSSVGGKTGVNHPLGKNMIGSFHQPQCVFIDTDSLKTLPDRELQSGVAEIIKYGLIRDAEFFEWQEKNMEKILARDPDALRFAIKRSCENKAAVVKADEKEAGLRATLNLGHTFGHAIENGSGYGTWLHGEAVAIGTAMAATMSAHMGWIDEVLLKRIYDILHRANLPVELPVGSPMTAETFLKLMSVDKKVADGKLRLILLKGDLGNCVFTGNFDEEAMRKTIDEFIAECVGSEQLMTK